VATAEAITGPNTFFEAIIAPGFEQAAMPILTERKKWGANLRLLEVGNLKTGPAPSGSSAMDMKKVVGGMLAEYRDIHRITRGDLKVVTKVAPTDDQIEVAAKADDQTGIVVQKVEPKGAFLVCYFNVANTSAPGLSLPMGRTLP
jgi:AICAR transformylase/IMP cyclohydrolase PurH